MHGFYFSNPHGLDEVKDSIMNECFVLLISFNISCIYKKTRKVKILKTITAHLTVFLENKGQFWDYVEFITFLSPFSGAFQPWLDLDWLEGDNEILNLQTSEIWLLMCGVCFKHLKFSYAIEE